MALSDPKGMSPAEHLAAIQRLERQREALESALSERSAEFRAQAAPVTLEAVRSALPDDAALIEFAVYRPFDPKAESNTTAYGAARYVAYVMTRRDTRGVDLGPASAIDAAVGAFRQALGDPRRDGREPAGASGRRRGDAASPRNAAGSPRRLLISPDGALNLLPFEALRGRAGALRDRALSHQLCEQRARSAAAADARIEPKRRGRSSPIRCLVIRPPPPPPPPHRRRRPLPQRAAPAAATGRAGPAEEPHVDRRPRERLVRAAAGHGARSRAHQEALSRSHRPVPRAGDQARGQPARRRRACCISRRTAFSSTMRSAGSSNPLLRSGLALTGANLRPAQGRDGDGSAARRGHSDRARGVEPRSVGHEARDAVGV